MQFSANPKICGVCGKTGSQFRCPCKRVNYCTKECQRDAWPDHKETCIVHLEKELAKPNGEAGLKRAFIHANLGTEYRHTGDYEKGKRNFNKALEICTGVGRDGDKHIPDIMIRFGQLHMDNDEYGDAFRMYFTAFNVCERTGNGSLLVQACEGMAQVFGSTGDTELACTVMDKLYGKITEWSSGEDHPAVLRCLILLEKAYCDAGKLSQGHNLLVRAREMVDRMGDFPNVLDVKSTIMSRASVYYFHVGDYDRAMAAQKAVLEIDRELYGEKHKNVAGSLYMMGVIFCVQHSYDEAQRCLTKALKIQRKLFGERHTDVANTMASLAGIHAARDKDYEKALGMFDEAANIIKAIHGPDHFNLAHIYHNLGNMKAATGDEEGARACRAESTRVGALNTRHCAYGAVNT